MHRQLRAAGALLALLALLHAPLATCLSEMGKLGLRVPPAQVEILRQRRMFEHQTGRRLLQRSYPSNAAEPGAVNAAGLAIYTPADPTLLDGDDFSWFLYDRYNDDSSPGVALTPGNYRVEAGQQDYKVWLIYFGCYDNIQRPVTFEINLEGSILATGNRDKGLYGMDVCSNILIRGGTVTYAQDQLPFTQGTVTAISDTNWTMSIDPGFPGDELMLNGNGHLCVWYDPNTGLMVQNGSDFFSGSWTSLGGGQYTFEMPLGLYAYPTAAAGLKAACRGDTYAQHVMFCYSCVNMRVVGTNIWNSNIFAFFEASCRNSTYDGVTVIPDPRGINGIAPLFSTNADGIHSLNPFSGPTIKNCVFSNTGDDAIALHGIYLMVASVNTTSRRLIIASWGCDNPDCLTIFVGDSLTMYSPKIQALGASTIRAIAATSNPGTRTGASVTAPAFNYDTANYFLLNFTSMPAAWSNGGPDGLVTVASHNGLAGMVINNTLGNNRARGIYYKGYNGQITNNRVLQPAAVGILLTPDLTFLEAGFNSNVQISGNYVNISTLGLFVSSLNATLQAVPYYNQNNISITGNTFESSVTPVIIGSATRITFTNNTIRNGGCYPYYNNDIFGNQEVNPGTGPSALVYVSYTTSSSFRSNTFTSTLPSCRVYGNYAQPYQRGPGVTSTSFS